MTTESIKQDSGVVLPNFGEGILRRVGNARIREEFLNEIADNLRKTFPEAIPCRLLSAILFLLHDALEYSSRCASLILAAYCDDLHENAEMDFYTEAQLCSQYCLDIPEENIRELKEALDKAGLSEISASIDKALAQARSEPPRHL